MIRTVLLPAAILAASPALACSVVKDYRVPTNFELVQRADLVVLARVEGEIPGTPAFGREPNVRLVPIRAIKGTLPAEPLGVAGFTRMRPDQPVTAPQPTPLDAAHPSTYWGACIRQAYAPGALVVATFVRTPEGYRQIMSPFARAVEDVESEDGLWVRAATLYASLADAPKDRLRAEAARLEAAKDDPGAAAIAADLRRAIGD